MGYPYLFIKVVFAGSKNDDIYLMYAGYFIVRKSRWSVIDASPTSLELHVTDLEPMHNTHWVAY